MVLRVLVMAAVVLTPVWAHAATVTYLLSADRTDAVAGEPFTVFATITADGNVPLQELTLPDLNGLRVLGNNRSESTQIQMGGGGAIYRRTVRIVLTLQADRPGKVTLGKGRVRSGKETVESNTLSFRVVPATGRPAPPPPVSSQPVPVPVDEEEANGSAPTKVGVRATPAMMKTGMFATMETDRSNVMLGEQVTLTIRLFSRTDLTDIDALRLPKLEGFWTEILENPQRIVPTMVMVENQRYQAYLLRRMAIFPTKAGEFELPAVEADITTGGGFFTAGRRHRVQSLPLTIKVEPLPAAGQPPGFQAGNVGHFNLMVSLDRARISLSQPATLTVRIEGYGNLRQAVVPRLEETRDIRVYDPTPSEDIKVKGDRFVGFKSLDTLVQPKRAGRLELPAVTFSFYDTETRQYVTRRGPALVLDVAEDDATAQKGATPRGNVLAAQARPVRAEVSLDGPVLPSLRGMRALPVLVGGPLGLSLLALVGGALVRARRARREGDSSLKAKAATRQLLAAVGGGGDAKAVQDGVHAFLQVRVGPAITGMTRAELGAALSGRGVDGATVARLSTLLERLDTARYAPAGEAGQQALAHEAVAVVRALDAALGEDA